jgi:hypothetical protein
MAVDVMSERETFRKYLKNRAALPPDRLAPYRGRWIAWSPDGLHVVADAENLKDLDDLILAAGEDPERCVLEGIPDCDTII